MPFHIVYHPAVRNDIGALDEKTRDRLKRAIENRLMVEPESYGQPLRKTLKGYWKLRVGDYRIIFSLEGSEIRILGICHRKDAYEKIKKRT